MILFNTILKFSSATRSELQKYLRISDTEITTIFNKYNEQIVKIDNLLNFMGTSISAELSRSSDSKSENYGVGNIGTIIGGSKNTISNCKGSNANCTEVEYLKTIIAEKERMIQVLLRQNNVNDGLY